MFIAEKLNWMAKKENKVECFEDAKKSEINQTEFMEEDREREKQKTKK